jgi:hypothetical protein
MGTGGGKGSAAPPVFHQDVAAALDGPSRTGRSPEGMRRQERQEEAEVDGGCLETKAQTENGAVCATSAPTALVCK